MKKTLITAVALAACAATPLFAQNVKEGVVTFNLTFAEQSNVSTSKTVKLAGKWSQAPLHYGTTTVSIQNKQILQGIGAVLHPTGGNRNSDSYNTYYPTTGTKAARLVIVQGELGGFFNVQEELVITATNGSVWPLAAAAIGLNYDTFGPTSFESTTVGGGTFAALATGRHYEPVPAGFDTEGAWPPGHHQPWGQIYVKDPSRSGVAGTKGCEM